MRIQSAEIFEAIATSHINSACVFLETLSQVKIHTPIKVDSRKNATVASMARREPKISPTYSEYFDQFVPNWNSRVMPVTIPSAKLIKNNFPQNFAALL
jgi:hypothetical protein